MMDALGFKGIWRRPEIAARPEAVVEKLVALRQATDHHLDVRCGGPDPRSELAGNPNSSFDLLHVAFLSDTIVLAVGVKDYEKTRLGETKQVGEEIYSLGAESLAIRTACYYTSVILAFAAATNPALAYRGCVTFGDFEVRESFLIGPAVDEAASMVDRAQGAFVWMAPSAANAFMAASDVKVDRERCAPYLSWKIPLKGGDVFYTYAVSPLANVKHAERTHERLMDTFNGNLDVEIKKQHTLRFLDACLADVEAHAPTSGKTM